MYLLLDKRPVYSGWEEAHMSEDQIRTSRTQGLQLWELNSSVNLASKAGRSTIENTQRADPYSGLASSVCREQTRAGVHTYLPQAAS